MMEDLKFNSDSRDWGDCATLAEFPDYCISSNGTVVRRGTSEIVPKMNDRSIVLDGTIRMIDNLLVLGWIGNAPFPIVPVDSKELEYLSTRRSLYRHSFLTYHVKNIIQDPDNQNIYWLDGVEFRLIPNSRMNAIISRDGVIYSLLQKRFVHRHWKHGYARANVPMIGRENASMQNVSVFLYLAYIGEIPDGMQVDHIDNKRYHNSVDNLQLLSHVDNTRKSRYEGSRGTPYTYEMMDNVCRLISENAPNSEVAKVLGLNYDDKIHRKRVIKMVYKLKNQPGYYDDLKAKYDMSGYDINVNYSHNRLSDEDVAYIREAARNGTMTGRALAAKYGVSPAIVTRIKQGLR